MSEADLIQQLAATTGPIGTMLAIGFMWIRQRLNGIDLKLTAQDKRQDEQHDRLVKLEVAS